MPSIPAIHEARDLLISLNRQLGPRQVQEPKGYEPCGYPSIAPQRLSSRPQPLKLPLALAKPSNPSSGSCHNTSSAHVEPTPGPCQPTCRTTPTVAPRQHYPRRRQEKLNFSYNFSYIRCGTEKTKKSTKDGPLHGQDVEDCWRRGNKYPLSSLSLVG